MEKPLSGILCRVCLEGGEESKKPHSYEPMECKDVVGKAREVGAI